MISTCACRIWINIGSKRPARTNDCSVGVQGNLSAFVEKKPEAKAYYDLQESSIKFVLPEPGFLEGIKSKDRAILKMHKVGFR
jgi:hypothetical protein